MKTNLQLSLSEKETGALRPKIKGEGGGGCALRGPRDFGSAAEEKGKGKKCKENHYCK